MDGIHEARNPLEGLYLPLGYICYVIAFTEAFKYLVQLGTENLSGGFE